MAISGPHITFTPIVPPKLEVTINNKQYRIVKLQERVGGKEGEWKDFDLNKLSDGEKQRLIAAAQKAVKVFTSLEKTPQELSTAHTLTLQFSQDPDLGPGLAHATLGRFVKRFAWTPQPKILQEITYQISKDSEEKTFKARFEQQTSEKQEEILEATNALAREFRRFSKAQGTHSNTKAKNKKPANALKLPIKEAGSKDNKCAARAIALITNPNAKPEEIDSLSENLVQTAKAEIQRSKDFIDPKHPNYSALLAAINNPPLVENKTPEEVRDIYLKKLNAPGQMLDLPFFLTLSKPTIILEQDKGEYKIKAFAKEIAFENPLDTLTLQDLAKLNIILYVNQNHYQAVIPDQESHLKAIQSIIQNYEAQALEGIQKATPRKDSLTPKEFNELTHAIHSGVYFSSFSAAKVTPIIQHLLDETDRRALTNASSADAYYASAYQALRKKVPATST